LFIRTSLPFSEIYYGLSPFSGILFKYEILENDVSVFIDALWLSKVPAKKKAKSCASGHSFYFA